MTSYGNITRVKLNTPNVKPIVLPVSEVKRINISPCHVYYGPIFDRYMEAVQSEDMFRLYNLIGKDRYARVTFRNGTTVDYQGIYDIVIGED